MGPLMPFLQFCLIPHHREGQNWRSRDMTIRSSDSALGSTCHCPGLPAALLLLLVFIQRDPGPAIAHQRAAPQNWALCGRSPALRRAEWSRTAWAGGREGPPRGWCLPSPSRASPALPEPARGLRGPEHIFRQAVHVTWRRV